MDQRKLYKTIEGFAARKYSSSEELVTSVLNEIVRNERIEIPGGRVWKLVPTEGVYLLVAQAGDVERIDETFRIKADEYQVFKELPQFRTVVANETNEYLRSKGILTYSATGIGDPVKSGEHMLYPYILSVNTQLDHEELTPTLNILGVAVTSLLRNRSIERKSAQLQKDLDKARKIQRSILPEHELVFHNYELFGVSVADRIVGGDFFDYILSEEEERLGIVIGDAASKGLSAAIQALYVSGAVRMGAEFQTKISTLMHRINELVHHTFADERFLTLFYGELTNDKKGLCVYANAGHNAPILYRASTGSVEFLSATGQIIGPFPNQRYGSEGVMIGKGDVLLLYTDGISEAMDVSGNQYTEDRIVQHLKAVADRKPREIAQAILEDAERFSARAKYSDDKTVVAIKRTK